jgi:hypothetical protein
MPTIIKLDADADLHKRVWDAIAERIRAGYRPALDGPLTISFDVEGTAEEIACKWAPNDWNQWSSLSVFYKVTLTNMVSIISSGRFILAFTIEDAE